MIGDTGAIVSTNYPGVYPAGTDCMWLLEVAGGSKIELSIHDLDIDQQPDCSSESLKVCLTFFPQQYLFISLSDPYRIICSIILHVFVPKHNDIGHDIQKHLCFLQLYMVCFPPL